MAPVREVTRCWSLWIRIVATVRRDDLEYSRVVACQLETGHAGEHWSASDWFEVWWMKESQLNAKV
jgi:hypothetical protein